MPKNTEQQAPRAVSFATELIAFGNNTGIAVPAELIDQLGAGKRPPVDVDLDGYRYRTTVGVMGGQHLIGVSAAIRDETGLVAGDRVAVTLTLNLSPRAVVVPDDFANALRAAPPAEAFFTDLPNSLQRYHVDLVTTAKSPDTRRRRIDKAVALFLAGKKR
jgi:Domain of unknown function (DUF1905)/Bacteriocin-protection, YdeI or OmpD-Associated